MIEQGRRLNVEQQGEKAKVASPSGIAYPPLFDLVYEFVCEIVQESRDHGTASLAASS
jgi:hypothetical protein